MTLKNTYIVFFIFLYLIPLSFPVYATSVPKDFYYKNKPIEPWCFNLSSQEIQEDSINLAKCSTIPKNITIKSKVWKLDNDYIGYYYVYKRGAFFHSSPYIFYRYLGKMANLHAIHVLYCNGSSGKYSEIFLFERKGNLLHFIHRYGGDRCNGGIIKATIESDLLRYSKYITAFDFLELAKNNQYNLKPYEDLQACAICCFGEAVYLGDTLSHVNLIPGFSLNKDIASISGIYQNCFENIYQNYVSNKRIELSFKELVEFTEKFNTQCVKPDINN